MSPVENPHSIDCPVKKKFNSFAVLDLETANLPQYKVGITELSIYGIAAEELEIKKHDGKVPELPRVLHKLTLMINPKTAIVPEAEKVTGLNNYMLEYESDFNENAANTLLNFLTHLRQPVCLVAHNGWAFDFPIVKHFLNKLLKRIPETLYCIDSLRAFHDIDQERLECSAIVISADEDDDTNTVENSDIKTVLHAEKEFDARAQNETTPKRPTVSAATAASKRKRAVKEKSSEVSDDECDESQKSPSKSKRSLDFGESTLNKSATNISYQLPPGRKWYPPKNIYKLGNLYTRTFAENPKQVHRAEADVLILTQLMLHYGEEFIDYAERHAKTFESIPSVGKNN